MTREVILKDSGEGSSVKGVNQNKNKEVFTNFGQGVKQVHPVTFSITIIIYLG
jgi:hypothetical protein